MAQIIVDGDWQTSGAIGIVRNRIKIDVMQQLAIALVVGEKEKFILDERAAEGHPKLVAVQGRLRRGGEEKTRRIQNGIAKILVRIAMEVIRTGFHGRVDHCAADATVFRAVVACNNLEFGKRVWEGCTNCAE